MTQPQHPYRWATRTVERAGLVAAISACALGNGMEPASVSGVAADPSTNGQTGVVGRPLPLPVRAIVVDNYGQPVSGVTVTWTVIDGLGTTSAATSVSDMNGSATVTWTLDTLARVDSLTASILSRDTVTITAFGIAGPPATMTLVSGNPQAVASGSTTLPLVVQAADMYGNPAPGVPVAWTVTGGGTLSASSTLTKANGQAFVTLTTGTMPGSYTVTATVGHLTPATFTITGT